MRKSLEQPLDARLIEAIDKSKRWMFKYSSLIDGLDFSTTNRSRVVISLHHLCIEHHTGIHTLVDNGVAGSAFALLRPQFEAYLRGVWYYLCAGDRQVEKFLGGENPPRVSSLILDLDKKAVFDEGLLNRLRKEIWGNLNDFTHGGLIQVKARNIEGEISQNYKPNHIIGLITSSATLALLAGVGISAVTDRDSLAIDLHRAFKVIYE